MGFSSGGSNIRTRSSTTCTIRRMPFVENFCCGVAVREPSQIHCDESLSEVTNGSSFLLNGRTRTERTSALSKQQFFQVPLTWIEFAAMIDLVGRVPSIAIDDVRQKKNLMPVKEESNREADNAVCRLCRCRRQTSISVVCLSVGGRPCPCASL